MMTSLLWRVLRCFRAFGSGPFVRSPHLAAVAASIWLSISPAHAQATAGLDALRSRAAAGASVPVIVGVRAAVTPEARLAPAQVAAQRAAIAAAQDAVQGVLPRAASARVRRFDFIPFMAMQVDAQQLEALARSPAVTGIQPDLALSAHLAQSTAVVRADAAWAAGRTGAGWTVAVLDSGTLNTHRFIGSEIVAEACFSNARNGFDAAQAEYTYSLCPEGAASSTQQGAASQCRLPDVCPHGTHVAGIAAGSGANAGVAYSGVAKGASLLPVQVFRFITPDNTETHPDARLSAFTSDILQGLQHVYDVRSTLRIAAVNMSLGGGRFSSQAQCDQASPAMKAAIDQLRAAGIATVVSSGNDGYADSLSFPACISSAISVGSVWDGVSPGASFGSCNDTGGADQVACYSNSASFLKVLAPGSLITSSTTNGTPQGTFAAFHGTSMAAPHVAGCIAILKEAKPAAGVAEIEAALAASGVPVRDSRNAVTTPRLDCKAALDRLLTTPPSQQTLSIGVQGPGSGSISSDPPGVRCASDCSARFALGSVVTLTATPTVGSTFTGWAGACSGVGPCTVNLNAPRNVVANFGTGAQVLYLSKAGGGAGSVFSAPSGLQCASACASTAVSFSYGTTLTLQATPVAGSVFAGWSGACSGTGACVVSLTQSRSAVARFEPAAPTGPTTARQAVQQVYVAYYGRPADPAGLDHWASVLDAQGGNLASIIQAFGRSDEFTRRSAGLSTTDLVTLIYRQLFNRAPDAGGLTYYAGLLASGRQSLQGITLDVMYGAQGSDITVLRHKFQAAEHYSNRVRAGCAYISEQAGADYLSAVTADPATPDAAMRQLDRRCGF